MQVQPWQIRSWTPVYIPTDSMGDLVNLLQPITTIVVGTQDNLRSGNALWAAEHKGLRFGIAWDWAEMRPNVPTLTDPMQLLSNIKVTDSEGLCLPLGQAVLYLNSIVHGLKWCGQIEPRKVRRGTNQLVC